MEEQQKYYVDENGQWEFPLGLRQLAMVQMDLNGRNKYGQDSGVGNVGNGLRMRFPIDRQRLEQSIQRVVDENDALRLLLVQKEDTYTQRVLAHYQFHLQVYEAQGDTEQERLQSAVAIASKQVNTVIDWFNQPSFRIFLVQLAENDYLFVWLAHHWIGDGSTTGLIMDQVFRYYEHPDAPKPETDTYLHFLRDETAFFQSDKGKKQLAYWKQEVEGYQMLDITKAAVGAPASGYDHMYQIDRSGVEQLAQRYHTSMFNVILLAYHLGVAYLLDNPDTIIGVTSANRTSKRYFRTMGYIAHSLQHRMRIREEDKLADLLEISKDTFSKNMANLAAGHYYDRTQFCLTYQNFVAGAETSEKQLEKVPIPTKRSVEQFFLLVFEGADQLALAMVGNGLIYTEHFLESLKGYMESVVALLSQQPDATLAQLRAYYEKNQ